MSALKPEQVLILTDSREQSAFDLTPLRQETATLATGDYTLAAAPDYCVIERKTGSDLLGCIGAGRERFERELARLRGFSRKVVLVESKYVDLLNDTRSKINPAAIAGSIASWTGKYAPFMFCGNRVDAEDFCRRFLMTAARELWSQAESFRKAIDDES